MMLPAIFAIELLAEMSRASSPLAHDGGHTTNIVGVISQDSSPLSTITMVSKSVDVIETWNQ
jgi:hypothetical protein